MRVLSIVNFQPLKLSSTNQQPTEPTTKTNFQPLSPKNEAKNKYKKNTIFKKL
jgi:hypothetical protein